MIRVTAAGRTHVGKVRDANEDAFHVGDSVFAVADGMGGHLAGEVASTTALEPIAALDGRVFADAGEATSALRDAVREANDAVVSKAADDPSYRGMGTTLTAVMVEGRRAHVAHVGDSRAYLLRDGEFSQLTTDHTLVQRLIEEGRLTREQAAQHPQRSVITRAIGVDPDIEVDAMVLDIDPGDVLLLCSDGLTGPVDDDAIAATVAEQDGDVDSIADRLVQKALDAGGPDNVTTVVLEFGELSTAPSPPRGTTVQVRSGSEQHDEGDWAARLGRFGRLSEDHGAPDGDGGDRRGVTRAQRAGAIVVAVGLIVGAVLAGGRWMLSRSYYVGASNGEVVIYQGVPGEFGPIPLSWEHEPTGMDLAEVPPLLRDRVEEGLTAADLADARRIVANFADDEEDGEEPGTDATESPAPADTTETPAPSPAESGSP